MAKKTKTAKEGRAKLWHGGPRNTGRMNLLEQEGRIRAEPQTRNVRAEEARVRGELNRGFKDGKRVSKAKGGRTKKQFGGGFARPLATPLGGVGGVGGVAGVGAPIRPVGFKHGKRVAKAHGGGIAQRGLGRAFTKTDKA